MKWQYCYHIPVWTLYILSPSLQAIIGIEEPWSSTTRFPVPAKLLHWREASFQFHICCSNNLDILLCKVLWVAVWSFNCLGSIVVLGCFISSNQQTSRLSVFHQGIYSLLFVYIYYLFFYILASNHAIIDQVVYVLPLENSVCYFLVYFIRPTNYCSQACLLIFSL